MTQFDSSVKNLFEVLASEIQSRSVKEQSGGACFSTAENCAVQTPADLIWWSWGLSIDPACRLLAGASFATWTEVCSPDTAEVNAADFSAESLAAVTSMIREAAARRFGSQVTCGEAERAEEPPRIWASVPLAINPAGKAGEAVQFSISPDLEAALGGSVNSAGPQEQSSAPRVTTAWNSADILMHVELPVTIILGRTKMRLKDLLKLSYGSVVELDQKLDEEVEVRVNNCVIAYGEVVSVDGNYAVRILRMAPPQNGDLRRELPDKAA